jgi:hypothetical protein
VRSAAPVTLLSRPLDRSLGSEGESSRRGEGAERRAGQ